MAVARDLIGRESARIGLRDHLDRAAKGTGALVVMVGEAGVGKSALVSWCQAVARDLGFVVAAGSAVEGSGPFHGLLDAIRPLLRSRLGASRRDDPFIRAVERLWTSVTVSREELSAPVLAEGVTRLVRANGGCAGLLVIEDVQWADPDTAAVVAALGALADEPLVVIVTTRGDRLGGCGPWLDRLVDSRAADLLRLDPFTAPAVAALAASRLATPPPSEVVDYLVARSDGLPLFVEELLAGLCSSGILRRSGDEWEFRSADLDLSVNVPRSYGASVARRLATLDVTQRRVLDAAAVLGRTVDPDLLGGLTGFEPATVSGALRVLLDEQFLMVDDATDTVMFRHALTVDAVLADALPFEKRSLARRAVELLAATPLAYAAAATYKPAAIARVAELAGGGDVAAAYWLDAATAARRTGGCNTAETLLERAARNSMSTSLRDRVDEARLDLLVAMARTDEAIALGEILVAAADADRRAWFETRLVRAAIRAQRWELAQRRLSHIERTSSGTHTDIEADLLAAEIAFASGSGDQPYASAVQVSAALAERHLDPAAQALRAEAELLAGRCARVSSTTDASRHFAAAARLAIAAASPELELASLAELATIELLEASEVTALREVHRRALDLGLAGAVVNASIQLGAGLGMLGRSSEAIQIVTAAQPIARRLGLVGAHAHLLLFEGFAHAVSLDESEMRRCVHAAATLEAPHDPDLVTGTDDIAAHLHMLRDERDQLVVCVERAQSNRRTGAGRPTPRAGLYALLRAVADQALHPEDEAVLRSDSVLSVNRSLYAAADAVRQGRSGDPHAAETFDTADRILATMVLYRWPMRLLVAEAALRDGWGDPASWLRELLASAESRRFPALATRARKLLRRSGAPIPRYGRGTSVVPAVLAVLGVTSREIEVLARLAQGRTNPEIAAEFVVSRRTIESHVANLLAKTTSADRAALRELARHTLNP